MFNSIKIQSSHCCYSYNTLTPWLKVSYIRRYVAYGAAVEASLNLQAVYILKEHICYIIFTFVRWALYKINCGSFCMNRTTFRDSWMGGVLVKTCIIALRRSNFLKENKSTTLSNLVFYLDWLICSHTHITNIKIELDYIRNWNMRR